jgi:hypothetical protein
MELRSDGRSDRVASLDAFKITRWPNSNGHEWHLAPLTHWARELIRNELDSIAPHERPQWTTSTALRFDLRSEAEDFARDIERHNG